MTCCPFRSQYSYYTGAIPIFSNLFSKGILYRMSARHLIRCKSQALHPPTGQTLMLPGWGGGLLQAQTPCDMDPLCAPHQGVSEAHERREPRVEGPVGHQLCLHMRQHVMTYQPEGSFKPLAACARQHALLKVHHGEFLSNPAHNKHHPAGCLEVRSQEVETHSIQRFIR